MIGPLYGDGGFDMAGAIEPAKLADSIFKKLDKNEDGKLSKDEFIAGAKSDTTVARILRCDVTRNRPKWDNETEQKWSQK